MKLTVQRCQKQWKLDLTDREAVDTSLRTVLTNASQPGVDGPVTADGSLDIPSNGTFLFPSHN